MRSIVPVLAALMFTAPAALAQEAGLLACSEVGPDSERLACYDSLAARLSSDDSERESAKWRVRESTSPIDDGPVVHMMLEADTTVEDLVAGEVRPKLWVTCEEGQVAAYVDWGFTIGGGRKLLTVRLDREEAEDAVLEISNSFESIGSWKSENVVRYLERMLDHNQFTVRTTSMSNDPLVAEFDIRGFDEAVKPLRAACGW
jgi:type VI secretion system protein VasI